MEIQVSRCDSSSPWLFRVGKVVVVFIPRPAHMYYILAEVIREKVHALTSLLGSMSLIVCSTLKSDRKKYVGTYLTCVIRQSLS